MEEKKELYLQQQIDLLTLQLEESKYKEESLKQMNSNLAQVIIQHSDPQNSAQLEGQINIQLLKAVEQLEIELNQNKERNKNQLQAYQNRAKDLERQIQSLTQRYLAKKEKSNQKVKELNNQILLLEKEKLTQMLQKQQLKEQYQDEIKELQCLIKQSQEKQEEYEQNIQKLKDDLQKQNLDNLEKMKKVHEQEKKALNSKIQEYQTNIELKNQQNKQNSIQNYIQQIELLKNEIYLKNMSLVRMNKKFSQFQEEIDEINTKYQEQTKSSLTQKIEYETNIQELQSQIWRLKKFKKEIVEQRDKLQAQVLFLNQSINNQSSTAYKELLAMKDEEIQEVKKSFKSKLKQIKLTNHKKIEESQKNNENLQKQICKDLQIIVEKEQSILGLKNEINKLKINVLEQNTHDQTILDKIKESIQQKKIQDQNENQNLDSILQNRSAFEKIYRNNLHASQERHPNTLRFINTKEETIQNQTPTQKENTKKRKLQHYEFSFTSREGPQNNQKQQKQNLRYQNKSARSKSIISSDMEDESLSCRSYNLVLQSE